MNTWRYSVSLSGQINISRVGCRIEHKNFDFIAPRLHALFFYCKLQTIDAKRLPTAKAGVAIATQEDRRLAYVNRPRIIVILRMFTLDTVS